MHAHVTAVGRRTIDGEPGGKIKAFNMISAGSTNAVTGSNS